MLFQELEDLRSLYLIKLCLPLNFRTSSLGSFTLIGVTELEVAPFSTMFWFKGLGGDPLMF